MLFNVGNVWKFHIGANNNFYIYNVNNVTLKIVDVERNLGVITNKNGKYVEQCLKAATKKTNCILDVNKEILNVRSLMLL